MKQKIKFALAPATGAILLAGAAGTAKAAIFITATRTPDVTFVNGTYDLVDFVVTDLTGIDAVQPTFYSIPPDPELLVLNGTFSAVGGHAVLGTPGATSGAYIASKYSTAPNAPQLSGVPDGYGASYVGFPNFAGSETFTGAANQSGSKTAVTGTSTSFNGTWYVIPDVTSSGGAGNVGGVEPGQDPQATGIPGLLAEILVTPGANVLFSGEVGDYGAGGQSRDLTFSTTTHPVITLTSGAPDPTYGQLAANLGVVRTTPTSYAPGSATFYSGGLVNGYTSASGFAAGATEVYGLALEINGVPLSPTDPRLATIINDINAASATDGVIAAPLSGATFAGGYSGYDLTLTSTTPLPLSNAALEFDFSQETNVPGLTVASIVAVPEPATLTALALTAVALASRSRTSNRKR